MKAFFKELFEYSHHYNRELATIFTENTGQVNERSIKLLSHILNAHAIWNSRILSLPNPCGVWDIQPVQEFGRMNDDNYSASLSIIDQYSLEVILPYKISNGQSFNNSIRDILFHVINHSTYHRAQIATEMKQTGLPPLTTDYIFYKR